MTISFLVFISEIKIDFTLKKKSNFLFPLCFKITIIEFIPVHQPSGQECNLLFFYQFCVESDAISVLAEYYILYSLVIFLTKSIVVMFLLKTCYEHSHCKATYIYFDNSFMYIMFENLMPRHLTTSFVLTSELSCFLLLTILALWSSVHGFLHYIHVY